MKITTLLTTSNDRLPRIRISAESELVSLYKTYYANKGVNVRIKEIEMLRGDFGQELSMRSAPVEPMPDVTPMIQMRKQRPRAAGPAGRAGARDRERYQQHSSVIAMKAVRGRAGRPFLLRQITLIFLRFLLVRFSRCGYKLLFRDKRQSLCRRLLCVSIDNSITHEGTGPIYKAYPSIYCHVPSDLNYSWLSSSVLSIQ